MTQLKSVSVRRSRWMPHLDEPTPFDETVLSELIRVSHSDSPIAKLKAAWQLMQASWRQRAWRRNH